MAPLTFRSFLRGQWLTLPDFVSDLTGKTVIVVGANVGLGFEVAKKFANMNPGKLILAVRNKEKGDEALQAIKSETGCNTLECWKIDLASFKSISAFVDRFEREGGDRLDILLENAALATRSFNYTTDGWEDSLQVNHLGTSLLALLLLPKLAATPGSPRITIVSSDTHYWVPRLHEADAPHILTKLNESNGARMRERYPVTKLFNVFFTRAIVERLKPSVSVTVNAVNPGLCDSQLRRNVPFPALLGMTLFCAVVARTTEVGSRTLVHASLWGSKTNANGKYFNHCQAGEESDYVLSTEGKIVQDRVWTETLDVLENADPRVKSIVQECLVTKST